jgi:altronate hydrolase
MIELSAKRISGPIIRLHPDDNIVVARTDVAIGTRIAGEGHEGARISSRSQVPAGYKIASTRILKGEAVRKYDVVIGFAAVDIEPGTMVHNHNMDFREFDRDYAHATEYRPVQPVAPQEQACFDGIVRADGRVATRNYIGVLSTVNCSATVVRRIADWFTPERLAAFP